MYNFQNDYSEGAHPAILERLIQTNTQQQLGYGLDAYCEEARALLRQHLQHSDASIYFVSAGTQANLLVISGLLQLHEAVICADSGHIQVHETGAIESLGHRIISVPTAEGKLCPTDVEAIVAAHSLRPHMVVPRLVYISNATETGTIYSREEVESLYACCQKLGLLLYLDGARLGHALMAAGNDLRLEDLPRLTDVFYIGATKNGGLLGEAIVFNDSALCPHFDYIMKQKGALLAKGRLLGIQFQVLFEDGLFFKLARHANTQAARMAEAIREAGHSFLVKPVTNQLFPILPSSLIEQLKEEFLFYEWKVMGGGQSAIRLITSWATRDEAVDAFMQRIKS